MKISMKEIKIEDGGDELLYVTNLGFIVKSETFSGAIKKACQQKGKDQGEKTQIDIKSLVQVVSQIVSQLRERKEERPAAEEKPPEAGAQPEGAGIAGKEPEVEAKTEGAVK